MQSGITFILKYELKSSMKGTLIVISAEKKCCTQLNTCISIHCQHLSFKRIESRFTLLYYWVLSTSVVLMFWQLSKINEVTMFATEGSVLTVHEFHDSGLEWNCPDGYCVFVFTSNYTSSTLHHRFLFIKFWYLNEKKNKKNAKILRDEFFHLL